jgi:fatty-acyl-CoA synthase
MRINIGYWPLKHAQVFPQKAALKSDRGDLTYAQLNERTNRLGNALRGWGVMAGDRVATLLFNVNEQVELSLACAKLGAIAVPMNFRLRPAELAAQIKDCTPRALIYDHELASTVDEALPGLEAPPRRVVVGVDASDDATAYEGALAAAASDEALDATRGDDEPLFIMYTAGTTGAAKGVVLSHANVFWQTVNSWALGIDPDATGLVMLPLFHTGGMNGSVLPLLHIGATVVLQKRWTPRACLAAIERDRVSGMVGVPVQYQLMAEDEAFDTTDFSSVNALISGGGPLPDVVSERYLAKELMFTQGYGLTEAAPGVTGMKAHEFRAHPGSIGRPVMYVDVAIEDASGRTCGPREEGEIIVSGPNVMLGYWQRPDETAKVLIGGRLYTGDLAYRDEDGYLFLSGRKKELIISGGENIHPKEVENTLHDHPGVAEATVIGVPHPRWTEIPVAAVVKSDPALDEEALKAFAAERMARYKVPHAVRFVDELPRNALGKVVKGEVAKLFS